MADYRIDDLAKIVGTTVRNIRAYQDRGLLAPPRILGRVGIYSEAHVARLRHITSLLQRGYASAQISELLHAWEHGRDLGSVIGLDAAMNDPWSDELPEEVPTAELRERLTDHGVDLTDRFATLGWVAPGPDTSIVRSPRLLAAFDEAVGLGFSKESIIALYEAIDPAVSQVATSMVDTAESHLLAVHGDAWIPDDAEAEDLAALTMRLRQLTVSTVRIALAKAMEEAVQQALDGHLARIVEAEQVRRDGETPDA